MREGRERGTEDENHVPQKHKKNAGASEKCFFTHRKLKKYYAFSSNRGADCETPFPVFLKICQKAAISGLIRFFFEAH